MITENLAALKIHKLTKEQYERALAAGRIDENALYMTPEDLGELSDYATTEQLNNHTHSASDIGAASSDEFAAHTNASNPHGIVVEIHREFDSVDSGLMPNIEFEYTSGNASKIYCIHVSYTANDDTHCDVFTIDWRMMGGGTGVSFRRFIDQNTYYGIRASKDSSGYPYFAGINCTIERIIGYY